MIRYTLNSMSSNSSTSRNYGARVEQVHVLHLLCRHALFWNVTVDLKLLYIGVTRFQTEEYFFGDVPYVFLENFQHMQYVFHFFCNVFFTVSIKIYVIFSDRLVKGSKTTTMMKTMKLLRP